MPPCITNHMEGAKIQVRVASPFSDKTVESQDRLCTAPPSPREKSEQRGGEGASVHRLSQEDQRKDNLLLSTDIFTAINIEIYKKKHKYY